MTLSRAPLGVRPRLLHRALDPDVRGRRRPGRDRPALPPEPLEPGLLGHRPRPGPRRPGDRGRRRGQRRRPARGDPGPERAGRARRHGAARAQELPQVPGRAPRSSRRSTPSSAPASRTARSSSSWRRSCRSRSSWRSSSSSSTTTCPTATSSPRSPAASPPSPASCPTGAGAGRRARRGGGPDPHRGRERRSAWSRWCATAGSAARRALGDEVRHAQEVGPAGALPRRRDVRRPRAAWRTSRRSAPGRCGPASRGVRPRGVLLLGRPGSGKIGVCKGARGRDGPAHDDPRRRALLG